MIGGTRKEAIVVFKADTSDLERGAYKATSDVETFGSKAKKAVASIGDAAKSLANGLDDIGRRTRNVTALFESAVNAINANAAQARAEYAAQGIAMDKVSASAGGLVHRTELLTFAAQAHHGAMKATDAQMQTAMVAMRQLTREGFDQKKVMDALTEAFVKADDGGLKQLGIAVRATNDPLDKQRAILEAVTAKSLQLRDATKTAAEEQTALGVKTSDAFEKMKNSIGQLVGVIEPLISLLASAIEKTAGFVAEAAKMAKESPEEFLGALISGASGQWAGKQIAANGGIGRVGTMVVGPGATAQYDAFTAAGQRPAAAAVGPDPNWRAFWNSFVDAAKADASAIAGEAKRTGYGRTRGAANDRSGTINGYDTSDISGRGNSLSSQTEGQSFGDYAGVQRTDSFAAAGRGGLFQGTGGFDKFAGGDQPLTGKQTKFLESTFGKLSEFDAYATAFSTLTGAVGASMGAWIDGSVSASKAFRNFIADAIKGLAIQMSVEALKHGAYAIGNLAMGNFAGAALHGKAAAGFAIGAVTAAGLARSLGTTAGDANRASSAGGASASGGASGGHGGCGSGGNGDRTFVLVADDPDETQRMKSAKYRRMFELGMGQIGYGVESA